MAAGDASFDPRLHAATSSIRAPATAFQLEVEERVRGFQAR
jgi:hypothetical protein